MQFSTQYELSADFFKPIWTGYEWKYRGKSYPSLRILNSNKWIKNEKTITKILADEIRKEIDQKIINILTAQSNSV